MASQDRKTPGTVGQSTRNALAAVVLILLDTVLMTSAVLEDDSDYPACTGHGDALFCDWRNLRHVPLIPSTTKTLRLNNNRLGQITSDSFPRYIPLSRLNLESNEITLFHPSWAVNLPGLRKLSASLNRLSALHAKTFDHLASLETLALDQNQIAHLWSGWCGGITNLVTLDMSGNKIASLNHDNWCTFSRLSSLDLSDNEIQVMNSGWADGMLVLSVLHLQHNQLEIIWNNTFCCLFMLQRLDLSDNKIKNAEKGWGRHLNATEYIKISHNSLFAIGEDFFLGMTELTWIDIRSSQIDHLRQNAFRNMQHVGELILENNSIEEINRKTLDDLCLVQRLRLQSNRIRLIEPWSFVEMKSLLRLYLRNNRIQALLNNTFAGLSQLTHLYLGDNRIILLELCWNAHLVNLRYLDLRRNAVSRLNETSFQCADHNLLPNHSTHEQETQIEFQKCRNDLSNCITQLKSLILSENGIGGNLEYGTFRGLSNLWHLVLRRCNLTYIASEHFVGVESLRFLDISDNNIVKLEHDSFMHLHDLVGIDASHNAVNFIATGTFHRDQLIYVDLRDNNIQTLSAGIFRLDLDVLELHLQGNPLVCTCKLAWLQVALQRGHIRRANLSIVSTADFPFQPYVLDAAQVRCQNIHGFLLRDIPSNQLPCNFPTPGYHDVSDPTLLSEGSSGNVTFNSTEISKMTDDSPATAIPLDLSSGASSVQVTARKDKFESGITPSLRISIIFTMCIVWVFIVIFFARQLLKLLFLKCQSGYGDMASSGDASVKYDEIDRQQTCPDDSRRLSRSSQEPFPCVSASENMRPPLPRRHSEPARSCTTGLARTKLQVRHSYFCQAFAEDSFSSGESLMQDDNSTSLQSINEAITRSKSGVKRSYSTGNESDRDYQTTENMTRDNDAHAGEIISQNDIMVESLVHNAINTNSDCDISGMEVSENVAGQTEFEGHHAFSEHMSLVEPCLTLEAANSSTDGDTLTCSLSNAIMERDFDQNEDSTTTCNSGKDVNA